MDELRLRLTDCFSAVLSDLGAQDVHTADMNSVEGWDSLATINLITVIEEEFGRQIPPEDLDQMVSFASILAYLRRDVASSGV